MLDGLLPQVATDLMNAKQYLLDHGWCKNYLVDGWGRVCMQGAIIKSLGGSNWSHDFAGRHRAQAAQDILRRLVNNTADYNNAPERTLEEILAKFDEGFMEALK